MDVIVTTRELRYGGKAYLNGARLTVADRHGKVLKLLRKVDDAPAEPPQPIGHVASTRPVQAQEPIADEPAAGEGEGEEGQEPAPAPTAQSKILRYRNRRLKSED